MEPEAGLAWYDSGARKLELVIGVQSPQQAAASVATLVSKNAADKAVGKIVAHCAYVGGAFGGKDHTIYPALRRAGRPVLARPPGASRQRSLRPVPVRHQAPRRRACAAGWRSTAASGRIAAFAADQDLDGGGLANLSAAVAFVGATASVGIYDVPKVDVTTVARHSRAVTAGSMRGFGALQTMTALEVMIDEAAARLGRDPVAFRKANLLKTGGKTMVGNVVSGALRSGEVLDRLASKPLWTGRAAEKARRAAAAPNKAYGVGLACVSTVFGSGSDPAFALVEIDPAGRITADLAGGRDRHRRRDRARGARGRQARRRRRRGEARRARRLGRARAGRRRTIRSPSPASSRRRRRRIRAGFPTSPRTPPHRSRLTSTPRSPPRRRTLILRFGLWPAALAIWSAGRFGGQAAGEFLRLEDVRFVDGRLTAEGMEPLALPRLAAKAHEMGLVIAAMVHGYNRWSWAHASFDLPDGRYDGRDRRARGQIRQRRVGGAQGADDDAAAISASIASR